ncbi:RHS repeat-associated core domain-containing protein [Cohnella panacarvi]|uniref:RHS repeat-associated core domain-containing protein n=1 Tax=Cohnella panacarvi TaxID=400776 RepID=UPI00047AC159|nr:RHS repeat-associated core domain-containing protein [Cohnella panacarvi]
MNAFTDALGGTTIRTYDAADRLISVSDPIGRQWQYWYDSQDRLASETSPSGATIEYRYSLSGELRSVTDALGNTTVFAYDDEGRLTETVNPNGARTLYEYDGVGKRTAVVDPLGRRISYSYNAVGRLKDIRDAAGQTAVRAVYDASGNVAQVSDALDRATRYRYNGLGRAVEVTDARGDKTVFAYDTAARLIEVVQSDTAVYTQQFDGENRLMRYSDANGNETTLAYDRSGKLTAERNAAGGTLCYSYDERGWLTERKNARGMSTKRSYDEAGQLVGVRDGAGVIELDYDSDGNLIRIEQAGANAKLRTYDALGRATSYTDAFGHTIHYAYDEAGYLTELIYPNGEAVHYRYNAAGQLTEARDWEGRVTRYDYDADGRLVRTGRPNGTLELRKYNEAGEVARLQNQLANGIVLQKYEFIYNELGQIIQEEEKRYTYDNLGRLAGGSMPGRKLFYRYDLAGNVTDTVTEGEAPGEHPLGTQLPLTYTKDNRLFAIGGLPVEYDADGNLLYVTDGKRMEAYTYDARDRLVRTGKTTYAYDAENVRTQVAHEGHTTRYVVDPQGGLSRVLWETDEEGNVKAKYVYGLGLIGRYVARGRYQSYHYDLRGSTVMLTDEHGKVTDRYAYGFYGEMEKHEGSTEQPFQYIGRDGVMTDPNRLCYMRARYYHPGLKRFLNRNAIRGDITDGQTFNRFAYVNGDPVNFIAPLGLTKECVGGKTSRGWGFSGPFWKQSGDFAGDCPINNHMQLARRISGNGGQITAIYSYLPAGVRNL